MTAAPPLSYPHCLIRARLSSQGPVVRQGLAESPPERWRRAAGTFLSSTSTRTALYDFIAPFFGRLSEVEDIVKGKLSRVVRYPRLPRTRGGRRRRRLIGSG
jgi:hypothetical protein